MGWFKEIGLVQRTPTVFGWFLAGYHFWVGFWRVPFFGLVQTKLTIFGTSFGLVFGRGTIFWVGACCSDVRTLAFCQRMRVPLNR